MTARPIRVRAHPRRIGGGAVARMGAHNRSAAIKVRRHGKWVPVSEKHYVPRGKGA